MSNIAEALGIICSIASYSFAAVVGAWAGIKFAAWMFGPFNIGVGPKE